MDLETEALSLRRGDFYLWRLFATAMGFALFGVGGVLLYALMFPLLWLLPGTRLKRRRRVRAAISHAFHLHVQFMHRTGVLTFEVMGAERLGRPGQMIIANHPSLIDVVFLISRIRNASCVVKQSLWRNPCMRGPISRAEYIANDGNPETLEHAANVLREGQTLIVFPEGTRTTPGQAPVFHRGASAIALRGARTITPVFISVQPTTLTKAEPWYSIPHRRFHVRVRVGADIEPAIFNAVAPLPVASRRLNQHLHALYHKELASP